MATNAPCQVWYQTAPVEELTDNIALFNGTLTGEQWANVAVTATTWLVLPALIGLRLVTRSEVK